MWPLYAVETRNLLIDQIHDDMQNDHNSIDYCGDNKTNITIGTNYGIIPKGTNWYYRKGISIVIMLFTE